MSGLSHRTLLRTTAVTALLTGMLLTSGCTPEQPAIEMPSAPHPIIIIDIDSLRADHLGCYGYSRATSPNLDALAAESIRFEWAFAQAPSTAPSQASILTGLYPTTHGMKDETTSLADEAVTLAEALSEQGMLTAAFVDGGYLSKAFGLAQGFDQWDDSRGAGIAEIGPKAIDFVRSNADESFLLLVHTYDPHVPYAPTEPHRSLFLEGLEPPSDGFEPTPEQIDAVRTSLLSDDPKPLATNDLEYAKALYDGEIHMVDQWVGELMTAVRELGLDRTATIVVISDHGQEFQEHGDLLHEQIHTTVTRIPFLIRLPHGQKNSVISHFVEAVDLAPTLLELSGASIPKLMQGDSLVPLILGQLNPPYVAYGESDLFGVEQFVALGGYRMILNRGSDTAKLYHLAEDPLELTDLAETEAQRLEQMRLRLDDWQSTVRNTVLTASDSEVDEETLEQLRGLGYIQ